MVNQQLLVVEQDEDVLGAPVVVTVTHVVTGATGVNIGVVQVELVPHETLMTRLKLEQTGVGVFLAVVQDEVTEIRPIAFQVLQLVVGLQEVLAPEEVPHGCHPAAVATVVQVDPVVQVEVVTAGKKEVPVEHEVVVLTAAVVQEEEAKVVTKPQVD